jgi:hypothetical protein
LAGEQHGDLTNTNWNFNNNKHGDLMGLSPMNLLKLATLSWGLTGDIVGQYGTVWESILIMWLCLKNSPILLFYGDSTRYNIGY